MIKNIYSIRDSKSEAFLQPFYSQNDSTATRAIASNLMSNDTELSNHSADYSLHLLGSFCDSSGKITPSTEPIYISSISSIKKTLKHNDTVNS